MINREIIKELNENESQTFLKEQKFGHLGCVLENGEPYLVPVNYLYLDETVYIHSLPGQKFDALRTNRKICLQVKEIEDSTRWQSVIVSGEFQEVKKMNEIIGVMQEFAKNSSN